MSCKGFWQDKMAKQSLTTMLHNKCTLVVKNERYYQHSTDGLCDILQHEWFKLYLLLFCFRYECFRCIIWYIIRLFWYWMQSKELSYDLIIQNVHNNNNSIYAYIYACSDCVLSKSEMHFIIPTTTSFRYSCLFLKFLQYSWTNTCSTLFTFNFMKAENEPTLCKLIWLREEQEICV